MPAGTFLPPGLTTSDVKIASGGTDNYVMTAVDGETIQGEANLTFDGTDLTIASGSIEVRTIDYSDGDLAMTIADGGGVTFAQATTFSGGITNSGTIAAGTWQGGTVAVGYGGTGATSLGSNRVLTGTGTSAITDESNLTFDGTTLTVATGKTLFTTGEIGIGAAVPDANYAIYMLYDFGEVSNVIQGFSLNVSAHETGDVADWFLRGLDVDARIGASNTQNWIATVGIRALEAGVSINGSASGTMNGVAGLYVNNATSGGMTIAKQYGIYMDNLTGGSTNVGIDLNGNTLENVGASGNDWTANRLKIIGSNSGSDQSLTIENDQTAAGSRSLVQIVVPANDTAGIDPYVYWEINDTTHWVMGIDNNQSDRLVISNNQTVGSNDAVRITTAEAITFENSTGSDFDYVCDGCGKSSIEIFACCGLVEWHDDVLALRTMRLSKQGIDQMVKLGVYELDGPNDADPGWLGVNFQKALHFTWSGMYQNRERMDAQNEAMDERLKRIEQALGV